MFVVIFVTAKDTAEANKIAAQLVEKKLIACCNILPGIRSVFWWDKRVDQSDEVLMVLKSRKTLIKKVIKVVKSLHSYQVPEIIALPIIEGDKAYLKWLADATSKK